MAEQADKGMELITLPHHAEFLSDRWFDEAARYWRELPAARRATAPPTGPFSLSERFTEAPPHLKLPGDVASWTLRFDGEAWTIARGFDADADLTIEGDYQAALYPAQFVG